MFQGFDPAVVDFMWGIRFNNEKTWFEAHKEEYKTLFEGPMKALCRELYTGMNDKYPELGLVSRVSRIYRDARRLFGRGPYKDHLWFTVSEPSDLWACKAVFWFELAPEEYSYGLGFWMAQASTLAKLRARMDRRPGEMEELIRVLDRRKELALSGEEYKKRRPAPTAALDPWYNRKGGFSVGVTRPHDELLFTPALADEVRACWEDLVPLYRYLSTLDGDPDPRP